MTNTFNKDEARQIQSVLDLFKKFFPFQINGKNLETLIVQGGMAVDISTINLAKAMGETGSAGTIATTLTEEIEKIKQFQPNENIIGINNLVGVLDYEGNVNYESNYELGKQIGADYIASGAGMTSNVLKRIINQADFLDKKHYWTIPIVSRMSQVEAYFKVNKKTQQHRRVGMIIIENDESGGHSSSEAKGFEETIEDAKEANIDKKGEKVIFAGGIRTPKNVVQALDAGFDAIQIGSLLLNSDEVNIFDNYKNMVLNAKKGDVKKVVSPSGFHAKGFANEGVMRYAMKGQNSLKMICKDDPEAGCFANCNRMEASAKAAGIETYGDYCINLALKQLHTQKQIYKAGALYFCGKEPEKIFTRELMKEKNLNSLPTKLIIGKLLSGVYKSIMNGDGLKDEHRIFLETQNKLYQNATEFKGKILQSEKY